MFKGLTEKVEAILIEKPSTRSSDGLLYYEVCKSINKSVWNLPFHTVMTNRIELGLPTYESVSRCRRKLQAGNEELKADAQVEGYRYVLEDEFKQYAISL